jgi:D-serine dehydratase|tara:strand:- start:2687 stop:3124 length:438 start_codon:yes stop_codon:yes gene_type:complete
MNNIQTQKNKYMKELSMIENNIDDYKNKIHILEDKIFNINRWIIKNDDKIGSNNIDISDLQNKIKLIDEYIDNMNGRKHYKTNRTLTIVNSIFLLLGFTLAYISNQTIKLGPDKLMKRKNIEYYFIGLLIIIAICSYSLFYFDIL